MLGVLMRKTTLSSEVRTKPEKASEDAHKFWVVGAEMLRSWYMFSINSKWGQIIYWEWGVWRWGHSLRGGWEKCSIFVGANPRQTESSTWLLTFLLEPRSKCGKREDTVLSQLESHSLQLFRNEKHKLLCECWSPKKSWIPKRHLSKEIFTHPRNTSTLKEF